MALGSKTEEFVKKLGIELTPRNYIKIDENFKTSNPKILAGGDLTGGKGTVAWAAKDGRMAAKEIIKQFLNEMA